MRAMRPSSRARICARAGRRRRAPVVAVARRSSAPFQPPLRRQSGIPPRRRRQERRRTNDRGRATEPPRARPSVDERAPCPNERNSIVGRALRGKASRPRGTACRMLRRERTRRRPKRGVEGRANRAARATPRRIRIDVAPGGQSRRGDGNNATARGGDDTKTRDGARRTGRPCSSSAATSTTLGRST